MRHYVPRFAVRNGTDEVFAVCGVSVSCGVEAADVTCPDCLVWFNAPPDRHGRPMQLRPCTPECEAVKAAQRATIAELQRIILAAPTSQHPF